VNPENSEKRKSVIKSHKNPSKRPKINEEQSDGVNVMISKSSIIESHLDEPSLSSGDKRFCNSKSVYSNMG
jgi:hypothetical protein